MPEDNLAKAKTDVINEWPLLRPEKADVQGQDLLLAAVNLSVSPSDGMYDGNDAYYLQVGASALCFIQASLAAAARRPAETRSVLDYACGFGRVLRWLCAAFPQARIMAVDSDAKAIAAVARLFEVATTILDGSLTEDIGVNFDLIWLGSLATHLPEESLQALLHRLYSLLSPKGGILVATMHGAYVAGRIMRGEKSYGLDPAGAKTLAHDYVTHGYGFSAYPGQQSYGIAVCTASKLMAMCESSHFRPILFQERGWVKHQDCIAVVRSGD